MAHNLIFSTICILLFRVVKCNLHFLHGIMQIKTDISTNVEHMCR